jgi:phosphoenolpyruvate phosphomutase
MGAHDGLSARVAAAEGFSALWASGLCISTALGLRDCDEVTWSQMIGVVESMVDASGLPVLVDGDTGYGNFNTARRFSRRVERAGAAGVCFEDKVFPKMNSFYGDDHKLAPVGEFCGKIRACKDTQVDDDFMLIARTETLIAGRSVAEAIDRASAYAEAGADGIFIHSRRPDVSQIAEFCEQWREKSPLFIAPTTYCNTPMATFAELGISGVIWANQGMRAAITAMRETCRAVMDASSVSGVEDRITSVKEIFELLDYERLNADEHRYGGVTAGTGPTP